MIQGRVDRKVGGAETGRGRWAMGRGRLGGGNGEGETLMGRRADKGQEWGGERRWVGG